jgi:hypothetical protein
MTTRAFTKAEDVQGFTLLLIAELQMYISISELEINQDVTTATRRSSPAPSEGGAVRGPWRAIKLNCTFCEHLSRVYLGARALLVNKFPRRSTKKAGAKN